MLKSISNNDYVALKLTNGEEVLGKLVDSQKDGYLISKPQVLTVHQDQSGPKMALVPYMHLSDDNEIYFHSFGVLSIAKMGEEIKKEYIRISSGLVMSGQMPDLSKLQM